MEKPKGKNRGPDLDMDWGGGDGKHRYNNYTQQAVHRTSIISKKQGNKGARLLRFFFSKCI